MRNVKREKGSLSFETDPEITRFRAPEKMQTMTVGPDSNTTDCQDRLSARECQQNEINSMRMSDDEENTELQKEFEVLMEENRKLKQQTQKKDVLKRKISMLRKENETLKCAQENQVRESLKPDSSEPSSHSSPKQNNHNESGVFAKSFLLTSTLGGIYIEPIDGAGSGASNGVGSSPSNSGHILSPAGSYLYKPEKSLATTETQTLSSISTAPVPGKSYGYSPRVKVATTEEDEEAHRFVQEFKARRIALKLTQSDIGEELNLRAGARYGQSYISRMESIQLSTAIVLRMKPLLLKLLEEKEEERSRLRQNMDFDEEEYQLDRKRKKRTNFTPEQSLLLTKFFAEQPRPSAQEIDDISRKIDVDRNSVKMWFNNKRQSEKFRVNPLPGFGSINSVSSLNPYANPYGSFLMPGMLNNMVGGVNPIVTTSSLNNLKLDYKLPNSTGLTLETSASGTTAPFTLNQLYNADAAVRLSNAVNNNLKKDSPRNADMTPSFNLQNSAGNPFIFNKELTSLYQGARDGCAPAKIDLYKERVSESSNGSYNTSPPTHHMPVIKAISPPNTAFSLSQSLINRTLSQAAANTAASPKYARTP